jgi:hypothetical protein
MNTLSGDDYMLLVIFRTFLVYVLVILAMRLMGKKTAWRASAVGACLDNTDIKPRVDIY